MKCNTPIDPETKMSLSGEALDAALKDPNSPRCGYELSADDVFCPACGARRRSNDSGCNILNSETSLSSKCIGRPVIGLDWAVLWFGLSVAGIVGVLVWSVFVTSTFWLFVLLCLLFAIVECAADAMVCIYKIAFLDEGERIPVVRVKVVRWISIAIISVPLLFPAYGFIRGGIESLRCIDDGKINLMTYFANKSGMNLLTRIGYRWIYHICWDFHGLEDRVLETSPLGFLSQMPVNASAMTGTVDDGDKELSQAEDDIRLGMKISTALMKNDYAKARRLARKISDKDLREFQLANIEQAESLQKSADDLKKSAKEFEDGMKAAAALQLLFGGR